MATVDASAVRVLQQPHLECAARSVELFRSLKNVGKDDLDNIFGFAFVFYDAQSHAEDEALVAVHDHGQSVMVAGE